MPEVGACRPASADDVVDPDRLAALIGPVRAISRATLVTTGYTAAHHERLEVTLATGELRGLVVKRVRLATDWTACRTGDRLGREAKLLDEPSLAAVWEVIECPYLSFWSAADEVGLVLNDLSPFLLPDVRAPLSEEQEERLLTALAATHARFWSSAGLDLPWLARAEHYAGLLDSPSAAAGDAVAGLPAGLRQRVQLGWASARTHLPTSIAPALARPAVEAVRAWAGLPRTLLHGDVKVANFALMAAHKVAAFDWAMLGAGPVTVDVGWYLAVNASRLARPKDELLVRYRVLLTQRLGVPLSDALWDSLVRVAVICGARMLLWSKALALESNGPGSREEWAWWVEHLEAAMQ
jgi:hypothetical protein